MRITYLHQYFKTPTHAGGSRSYEMARRLVDWGHDVHMVTSDRTADPGRTGWHETLEAGIHVHWLPVRYANDMGYGDRLKAFKKFALGAARRAASLACDVVFATSTPLTVALPAVYAARRQKVPMVFEVRDLWPDLPIAVGALRGRLAIYGARQLERFAYRNAARIVALSPGMRDGVAEAGYPEDRIHVIPNSADLDLFNVSVDAGKAFRERYDWLGHRPLIVYAGTIGRINGVSYLARLAAAVKPHAPEVRFLVIGDGQERRSVEELAMRLGVLGDNLHMLEQVAKSEMPAVMSAATIATSLVIDLKELWANSANKFFDALASGTPVAINHGGWQAEMLKASDAGLVLDPQDIELSARRLIQALEDETWLERAGRSALHLAQERFARDDLAKELERVLQLAVHRRGDKARYWHRPTAHQHEC